MTAPTAAERDALEMFITLTEDLESINADFAHIRELSAATRCVRDLLLRHMRQAAVNEVSCRSQEGIMYTAKIVVNQSNVPVQSSDVWHSLTSVTDSDLVAPGSASEVVVDAICARLENRVTKSSQKLVVGVAESCDVSTLTQNSYLHQLLQDFVRLSDLLKIAKSQRKTALMSVNKRHKDAKAAALGIVVRTGDTHIKVSGARTVRFWCTFSGAKQRPDVTKTRAHIINLVRKYASAGDPKNLWENMCRQTSYAQLENEFEGAHKNTDLSKPQMNFIIY